MTAVSLMVTYRTANGMNLNTNVGFKKKQKKIEQKTSALSFVRKQQPEKTWKKGANLKSLTKSRPHVTAPCEMPKIKYIQVK